MMAEHGDRFMLDAWQRHKLPFGEFTEQSVRLYDVLMLVCTMSCPLVAAVL